MMQLKKQEPKEYKQKAVLISKELKAAHASETMTMKQAITLWNLLAEWEKELWSLTEVMIVDSKWKDAAEANDSVHQVHT